MPSYAYNDGDGLAVIDKALPNGAVEPTSNLDDALKQVKAYLKDATAGVAKIQADVTSTVALVATHTTTLTTLTTGLATATSNISTIQTAATALTTRVTALESQAAGATPTDFVANMLAVQTIAAGAGATLLLFNSASLNNSNGFSTSTGKFTAPTAGFYQFSAALKTTTSASSSPTAIVHTLAFYKNAVVFAQVDIGKGTDITGVSLPLVRNMQLVAGDIIDVRYQLVVGSGTMSSQHEITSNHTEFSGLRASA